ncbi:4282_t:CDS:2 [Dentiscutata erythropus]|uniref:4282_t:CDS:1 n=1 Tax=Dentiscutata erythropus TaxID=1348616 RepID=A0A9N9FEA4_9GLOM|nr:4282_t:CDS:2 [Dentiscutata erythropus]
MDLSKRVCDKCKKLEYCNQNTIVLNNCCNVENYLLEELLKVPGRFLLAKDFLEKDIKNKKIITEDKYYYKLKICKDNKKNREEILKDFKKYELLNTIRNKKKYDQELYKIYLGLPYLNEDIKKDKYELFNQIESEWNMNIKKSYNEIKRTIFLEQANNNTKKLSYLKI